ncbi:MAG: hypothetical protein Q7T89_12325 [Anaerolineales bacterium]|nr:hypothetical protein [Anaerolineales bacterium]
MNKFFQVILAALMLLSTAIFSGPVSTASAANSSDKDKEEKSVKIEMFAPAKGDHVGIGGKGWFVDLAIGYEAPLAATGFTGFQLTGPAAHNNVAPFPGTFSAGKDDRLPNLVVLLSTTTVGAGAGQNLANLFNLTGVTDLSDDETELWDTWIVGAPNFGVNTESTIYVAVVDDLNGNGIFDDAPSVVPDSDMDGDVDEKDLKALGLASKVEKATFFINP